MIIKFSKDEALELKNLMEQVEAGSSEQAKQDMENTNLVSFNETDEFLEISVDKEYLLDFFKTYGRFSGLFVSQLKAMWHTLQMLSEDIRKVVEHHINKHKGE